MSLLEFYKKKDNVFEVELEFSTITDNNTRIIQISFYTNKELDPLSKIFVIVNFMEKDGKIWLKDANSNVSEIIATDVMGSNGVIHVIDTVVMPK